MTLLIVGVLAFAVFSLGQAMFAMARGPGDDRMMWALTRRIGASVLLFALLMLGWKFGWIQPHGLQ
jgi:cytochrome b561